MRNGNGTKFLSTFIVSSAYDEPAGYDMEGTKELVQDQFIITDFGSDDMPRIQWRHPLLAVLLICICLFTILGNVLVVTAVCTKRYLRWAPSAQWAYRSNFRNPTGYLIVSLAFADLIVGIIVMPVNSLFEMSRHVWLLGLTACDLFHAFDVLASTSSIWNLCVISLDRYMAGQVRNNNWFNDNLFQDPIGYRDKVSKRRITIAIISVWILSACKFSSQFPEP